MKRLKIKILGACFALALIAKPSLASDASLAGTTVQVQYESGPRYLIQFTANDVTWTGIQGDDAGKSERDVYQAKDLGRNSFLVSWTEHDGTFVALFLDLLNLKAYSTGRAGNETWFWNGKIISTQVQFAK